MPIATISVDPRVRDRLKNYRKTCEEAMVKVIRIIRREEGYDWLDERS